MSETSDYEYTSDDDLFESTYNHYDDDISHNIIIESTQGVSLEKALSGLVHKYRKLTSDKSVSVKISDVDGVIDDSTQEVADILNIDKGI